MGDLFHQTKRFRKSSQFSFFLPYFSPFRMQQNQTHNNTTTFHHHLILFFTPPRLPACHALTHFPAISLTFPSARNLHYQYLYPCVCRRQTVHARAPETSQWANLLRTSYTHFLSNAHSTRQPKHSQWATFTNHLTFSKIIDLFFLQFTPIHNTIHQTSNINKNSIYIITKH